MMMMKMKMMMKMMVFLSVLIFCSRFCAGFPLKGVFGPVENPTNTTHLLHVLVLIHNTSTSSAGESGFSHLAVLVGGLVFITLLILSFSMLKTQESVPGGVLGSIIHYPAHSLGNTTNHQTLLPPEPNRSY